MTAQLLHGDYLCGDCGVGLRYRDGVLAAMVDRTKLRRPIGLLTTESPVRVEGICNRSGMPFQNPAELDA